MLRVAPRLWLALLAFVFMFAAGETGVTRAAADPAERLVLAPTADTTFRVQVVYPNTGVTCEAHRLKDLHARYRGTLEVVRQADGRLAIIDHLTFDEYLQGISEMPRSWPLEALKAQVVAARTYALYHLQHPLKSAQALGYDICSTDQCQVFRGLSVSQGAFGEAWVRAVDATRGRVLRYRGRTIQAFYHSTSPGRTKSSFPGGSPEPYLASVPGQDGDSPLAHWSVSVPMGDLGPILHAGGDWPGGTVSGVTVSGDRATVAGSGRSVTISKESFRSDLDYQAPCVFPGRYPTNNANGDVLPETVPSIDFTVSANGSALVLTGRGWGHGVGMSQYGAKSLAEKGRSYGDILAYYFAGIHPVTTTEPGAIRVLVAEDASIVRVAVDGSATATTSTGSMLGSTDRFEVRGGPALDIRRGVGPSASPVLTVTLGSPATLSVPAGGQFLLSYTLSGSARVALAIRRGDAEVFRTPEVSQVSGPNTLSLTLDTTRSSPPPSPSPSASPVEVAPTPLDPGDYEVTVEAFDGLDRVRTAPVALIVHSKPAVAAPVERSPSRPSWHYIVAGIVLAGGAVLVFRRRSSARS